MARAPISGPVWFAISATFGVAIVIGNYWRFFKNAALSFGRWFREAEISVGKSSIGWIVAVLLLVLFIAWTPITNWMDEQGKAMQVAYDPIRTRPICGSTCKNFDWIVGVCKREAVEIGMLRSLAKSSAEKATRYFRGCLIDKGMNWERCNKGEAKCMRLRYIGRLLGAYLPSFME